MHNNTSTQNLLHPSMTASSNGRKKSVCNSSAIADNCVSVKTELKRRPSPEDVSTGDGGKMTEAEVLKAYKSGNPKVEKAMKIFFEVFKTNIKDFDPNTGARISRSISNTIYELHLSTFPTVFRSKIHNLRNNKKLCAEVYNGNISASEFIKMSANEMKTDEQKTKDSLSLKESLCAAQVPVKEAETTIFTCSHCKKKECTYSQMQTRSCDEPMTTFVHCTNCGHHWKF